MGSLPPLARRAVRTAVPLGLAVAAGVLVVLFVFGRSSSHAWSGTAFADPQPAPALDGLQLDDGTPADLGAYRGEVVVVYFGYTSCPDVCPLTLSQTARALDALGDRGDEVQVVMISVDPARDTLEVLGEYVRHFDDRFVGMGGTEPAVLEVAGQYGVYFQALPAGDDGFYEVDHTSTLLGIDRDGNLKVVWNPDVDAGALEADLEELLG